MGGVAGKTQVVVNTAAVGSGDSIAAYLADGSGNFLESVVINTIRNLQVHGTNEFLQGSAYAAGVDYLGAIGVVDSSGNWAPLTLNASGEVPVAATVNFAADYPEDTAHVNGDVGLFGLSRRIDARASSADTSGDYAAFNTNAVGELWVKDADTLAQLVLIKSDTAAILADTATIDSQTLAIQNLITALSKAEDAVHSTGDQGIQFLGIRQDTTAATSGTTGDYSSIQTWSNGEAKTVDIVNLANLQQIITVGTTATAIPTMALRKLVFIQNLSSNDVYVGSATVTNSGATRGFLLGKGGYVSVEAGPTNAIYVVASGAGSAVSIWELS